jgi:hypothetical protein
MFLLVASCPQQVGGLEVDVSFDNAPRLPLS